MPERRFPTPWSVADWQQRSTNLSRSPQIGPCVHTIRGDDLIASVGMGKIGCGGWEVREAALRGGLFLTAERPGVSGDGVATQLPLQYGRIDQTQIST